MQIVIIGGMNKSMTEKLDSIISRSKSQNTKVYIRGFITDVNDYLAASDIVAGRAGINTILEAMYMHRPFLITELVYTVIPSADYVEKYKIGWNCANEKEKAVDIVCDYVQNPEKLIKLDASFNALPIEFSASKVASIIIDNLKK